MDKQQLLDELLDLLGDVVVPGDIRAKVQAMESGDDPARRWLIGKLILAAKSGRSEATVDRLKVDAALDLALRLTGWEAAEL